MRKTKHYFILPLVILVCILFSSCKTQQKEKFSTYSFDLFDTATTITGYAESKDQFDQISEEVLALLREYHRLFTIYNRYEGLTNLCSINDLHDGVHKQVEVDSKIIDMLLFAKDMYKLSDGKVNIAMGSVLSIWHEYREEGLDEPWNARLPSYEALSEASRHTDIDALIIDKDTSTAFISDPDVTLDVGAIAKGYAVEMAARYLEEKGISGYVINVGGNVRTIGTKPDGEKWLCGIENPDTDSENAYIKYIEISDKAIVTSGSYQRYYVVDGKNYHHIIDSETLMPAEGFVSVSVICDDSGLGDALSTALFCMSFEEGLSLVESLSDVEAMWVISENNIKTSSGFSSFVTER